MKLIFLSFKLIPLVSALCVLSWPVHAANFSESGIHKSIAFSVYENNQPMPSPDMQPQYVVAVQLKALRDNDEKNAGIATAYNFAAPSNKAFTGSLGQFVQLVKNTIYAPLLNFKKCELNRIHIEGDEAQQIAIITDKDGKKAAYLFSLSKQTTGPYKGCWMTEGVIRLAYEEKYVRV